MLVLFGLQTNLGYSCITICSSLGVRRSQHHRSKASWSTKSSDCLTIRRLPCGTAATNAEEGATT